MRFRAIAAGLLVCGWSLVGCFPYVGRSQDDVTDLVRLRDVVTALVEIDRRTMRHTSRFTLESRGKGTVRLSSPLWVKRVPPGQLQHVRHSPMSQELITGIRLIVDHLETETLSIDGGMEVRIEVRGDDITFRVPDRRDPPQTVVCQPLSISLPPGPIDSSRFFRPAAARPTKEKPPAAR